MENWNWAKFLLFISFIIFLGSLLLRQESAITQDLGRHLRLGEMIVTGGEQRKCALFTNCLTYTYPDYAFINHHWGSEVIFYFIHKLGGFSTLIVFKSIILGSAFVITVFHAANKGLTLGNQRLDLSRFAIAAAMTLFSIQMMADRLTTRPEIFGYLLFPILFWILNSSFPKRHFSLLLVSCSLLIILWTNLHISFVFGLLLIYLWTAASLITQKIHIWPAIMSLPVVATMATLLNPAGPRGALMPLSILKDYGYTIVENMTPFFLRTFKPQPEYWIYTIIIIVAIGLFLFSSAKKNPFHLLTFLTFSFFPLIAVRHLPFFALTVVPVLTPLIAVKFRPAEQGPASQDKLPIIVSVCLLLAALTNPVPLAYGKLPPIGLTIDSRHNSAVEFVKQNNLKGPMWNNYDIGSFLEWTIPEHKTFVDGRPEAFPIGFFQKTYIPMQENKASWGLITTKYDIQWVFAALTDATPWFSKWWQMIQNHEGWRIVYIDNYSAVLVRINGNNNLIEPQGKAKLLKMSNLD